MTNQFRSGLLSFRDRLLYAAGTEIVVKRGTATLFSDVAVCAKTDFDAISDKGLKTTVRVTDFVVANTHGWIPERGDRIYSGGAVYVVRMIGAEWFRYDDADEVMIRVHTQREGA